MSAQHMYILPLFNTPFTTLEDAKWNVKVAFTRKEAIRYFANANEKISHYLGDKLLSETPVYCDEHGNITFGRTRRLIK